MADQVADLLEIALRKTQDKALRALDKLEKLAGRRRKTRSEAIEAIRRIALEGKNETARAFAGFALKDAATEGDAEAAAFFREQLGNLDLCYSCMAGLLVTVGAGAYSDIVDVANDSKHTMEHRGLAVRALAKHSGHPFDRHFPEDFHD